MESAAKWTVWALLAVQVVGLVLSLGLFAVTYAQLDQVTARLQGFAVDKVEEIAAEALEGVETRVEAAEEGGALANLAARFAEEADLVEATRERIVPQLVAYALSDDCGDDCVPAFLLASVTNIAMVERAANLRLGETTVRAFIAERYERTLTGLIQDLRRFGAVNALAFALMIGLLLVRKSVNWRFTAFSVGLLGVTLYMTDWYLFGQDWGRVILFQDFTAELYQGGMIFACCVMIDWLFLRAFFTRLVGNMIGSLSP